MKIVSLGNRESTDPYNAQNVGTQDQIKIMANKVSFKVCLNSLKRGNKWKEKNKCETQGRRFVLDKDGVNLTTLQLKICQIFPDLSQKAYFLSWADEDRENVTIATDDELEIALMEMTGPVYKLDVNVMETKKVEIGLNIKDLTSQNCNSLEEGHGREKLRSPRMHHRRDGKINRENKKRKSESKNYRVLSHEDSDLFMILKELIGDTHQCFGSKQEKKMEMKVLAPILVLAPVQV